MTPPMTPQSLSIADLKAVIDITVEQLYNPHKMEIYHACLNELHQRIASIHPPTEPKNEEK